MHGFHSNMCACLPPLLSQIKILIGNWFPSVVLDKIDKKEKIYPLSSFYSFLIEETGYTHLQSTKPDTIGEYLLVNFNNIF